MKHKCSRSGGPKAIDRTGWSFGGGSVGGSVGGAEVPVSVGRLNRRCHVIMLMKQPDDEWTCATVELQLMQSA